MNKLLPFLFFIFLLQSCNTKTKVDRLFVNGTIYTVDSSFAVVNSLVIDKGKIVFAGDEKQAREHFEAREVTDLKGRFVYPGFIDAHCHFYGYATDMVKADLTGTQSWQEVLDRLKEHAAKHPSGWLLARGWDQNDWARKEFPKRYELDKMFPDRPVYLVRIDGHAALANKTALKQAGITSTTKVKGGLVQMEEIINGEAEWTEPALALEIKHMHYAFTQPTGMLIDHAMGLVESRMPDINEQEATALLLQAQKNCFEVGLTTVCDAGLSADKILMMDTLQQSGKLKMRMYAMVSDDSLSKEYFFKHGVLQTDRLHVCSMKYYADGALGSRGACLKAPYADQPSGTGWMLKTEDYFLAEAKKCSEHGFQMNTHCIGDSANAVLLRVYGEVLKGKNDKRWRIEHCQVVDTGDIPLFGRYSVIPSVQPTHATSDMYWAKDRLGEGRMKGAYAYNDLLKQNGFVANGSDFPVESVNPLFGFYAAVARKDQKGFPQNGFQTENAMSRENALRGMTCWAAYAAFEDKEKGSLEMGKVADLVIVEQDLMKAPADSLFKLKVKETWIGGERVY